MEISKKKKQIRGAKMQKILTVAVLGPIVESGSYHRLMESQKTIILDENLLGAVTGYKQKRYN